MHVQCSDMYTQPVPADEASVIWRTLPDCDRAGVPDVVLLEVDFLEVRVDGHHFPNLGRAGVTNLVLLQV